jgi:hypothetical protein
MRCNVPEHLLEDVAELLAAKLVRIFLVLCLSTEAKCAPWEAETCSLLVARLGSGNHLFWVSIVFELDPKPEPKPEPKPW